MGVTESPGPHAMSSGKAGPVQADRPIAKAKGDESLGDEGAGLGLVRALRPDAFEIVVDTGLVGGIHCPLGW